MRPAQPSGQHWRAASLSGPRPQVVVLLALLLLAHLGHAPHVTLSSDPALRADHSAHATAVRAGDTQDVAPPSDGATCGAMANLAQRTGLTLAVVGDVGELDRRSSPVGIPSPIRSAGCRSGPDQLALLQVFRN